MTSTSMIPVRGSLMVEEGEKVERQENLKTTEKKRME